MRKMHLAAPLMLGLATAAVPVLQARAQISISFFARVAPPALPVYTQPPLPAPGYIWAPGYWAWDTSGGYYWVPGSWVQPPKAGLLWTPGYWGYENGYYVWHPGYWGPHVGFYGGVNYGHGYNGNGYHGGYWRYDHFYYNRDVNNFGNIHVNHIYARHVNGGTSGRVSYNGGHDGVSRRPTRQEIHWRNEHHIGATANQRRQAQMAEGDGDMFAAHNHGMPPVAATRRPTDFTSPDVVRAQNAPEHVPGMPQHHEHRPAPQHGAGNQMLGNQMHGVGGTAPQYRQAPIPIPHVITPGEGMNHSQMNHPRGINGPQPVQGLPAPPHQPEHGQGQQYQQGQQHGQDHQDYR